MRKFNINVDGTNYVVEVEEVGGAPSVAVVAPVVATPVAAAPVAKKVGAGVPFKSPMPGLVKGIKVKSGVTVKKGDVVVILEAMKMENDMSAPADGVVTVSVAEGSQVNSGDVLFTIA